MLKCSAKSQPKELEFIAIKKSVAWAKGLRSKYTYNSWKTEIS